MQHAVRISCNGLLYVATTLDAHVLKLGKLGAHTVSKLEQLFALYVTGLVAPGVLVAKLPTPLDTGSLELCKCGVRVLGKGKVFLAILRAN